MATTGTGKWVPTPNAAVTAIPMLDFFSGEVSSTSGYVDNTFDFGFAAHEIVIVNKTANRLAFQFPRWFGKDVDDGIVEGNAERVIRYASQPGIAIRSEASGSDSTFYVMAN